MKYLPSQVAEVTGLTTDMQRSYRQRGAQIGGVAINGRFNFSAFDVFEAGLFYHIYNTKVDSILTAWNIAQSVSESVAIRLSLSTKKMIGGSGKSGKTYTTSPGSRYACVSIFGNRVVFSENPLASDGDWIGMIIDIDKLAASLPSELTDFLAAFKK